MAPLILNLCTRGSTMVSFTPRPSYPLVRNPRHSRQKKMGDPGPIWSVGEQKNILPMTGLEPPSVGRTCSLLQCGCTDGDILVSLSNKRFFILLFQLSVFGREFLASSVKQFRNEWRTDLARACHSDSRLKEPQVVRFKILAVRLEFSEFEWKIMTYLPEI
jgi:hypothetical protein